MSKTKDWLPKTRAGIVDWARNWSYHMAQNLAAWSIPASVLAEFNEVRLDAEAAFAAAAATATRTVGTVQAAQDAQRALVEKMRSIKARYFHVPPLTLPQLRLLGFDKPDEVLSSIPAPLDLAGVDIVRWAPHILELHLFLQTDLNGNKDSNYQFRVKYAPVAPGGSGKPAATMLDSGVFVLSAPPRTPKELPNEESSRASKLTLELPEETSGMACYLAARYATENNKNGPLGEMIQTVIP